MALSKSMNNEQGYSYEYHRIKEYTYLPFQGEGCLNLVIESFKDSSARQANKQPVKLQTVYITQVSSDPESRSGCYNLLKDQPEWSDSEDC